MARAICRTALVLVSPCVVAAHAAAQGTAHPRVADHGTERGGRGGSFGPASYAWRLRTLDGRLVSFSEFRGRPIFLNVWATWCVPCVAELSSIRALADSLREEGVAFVLLSPESTAAVQRFAQRNRVTAPIYIEADAVPREFRLRGVPTTYVIDPSGDITLRHYGAADWDTAAMRDYLRGLGGPAARTATSRPATGAVHATPTSR